jgi:hypothetical protein
MSVEPFLMREALKSLGDTHLMDSLAGYMPSFLFLGSCRHGAGGQIVVSRYSIV